MDHGIRDELLSRLAAAVDRARIRDQTPFRSEAEAERRYRSRYLPSQLFYFDRARPADHADIIVHNDEPQHPAWETRTR